VKYIVPDEYLVRLHHARPRFKRDVENVLIFMVREICHIGKSDTKHFERELERAIYRYPGNANLELKTVKNWRTEIDALFGLIVHEGGFSRPSALANRLAENLDLISFFRIFLAKFQYPGGHLKPNKAAEMVRAGVRFKPAAFVIRVLLEGQNLVNSGRFWLTKAEATHLIWNDIRVTSGLMTAKEVASNLIHNRSLGVDYDNSGDVVRYAGDILDYMVLGNVIDFHPNGRYFLIPGAMEAANLILSNSELFQPYEHLYKVDDINAKNLSALEGEWFKYAGDQIDDLALDTDPLSVLESLGAEEDESANGIVGSELLMFLRENLYSGNSIRTKDIGDTGESLVLRHEFNRLKSLGLESLGKKVKKIPDHLGIGYDLKSWLDSEHVDKLIEVKTSISKGALRDNRFHLTKSEWNAANSSGSNYYVYRILISSKSVRCFVIHNPIDKYKRSLVNMSVSDGADLSFTEDSGHWEQLLI
jgi:hypothetical protein